MLNIICGENNVASRNYYVNLRQEFSDKGIQIKDVIFSDIIGGDDWLPENASLFYTDVVFFTENLNKKINRKNRFHFERIKDIASRRELSFYDWEDAIPSRELKIRPDKNVSVKEFKPTQSIFKLLDSCYPSNLTVFSNHLRELIDQDVEAAFIFLMLSKHIKKLLLVKQNQKPDKLADWQIFKLKKQSQSWTLNNLISFYESLHKIDLSLKTSSSPFSADKALGILACYFL
ncbi:hypothetical protein GYA28_00370 [Candidatus Roizmanbacteria bacterium]|nr:hypothetical protein [Candidatus Roizmanbacteria bacterium]